MKTRNCQRAQGPRRPRFWVGRRKTGLEMGAGLLGTALGPSGGLALGAALRLGWAPALPAAQPGGKADT